VGLYCAREIRLQKAVDAAERWPGKKTPLLGGLLEWDRIFNVRLRGVLTRRSARSLMATPSLGVSRWRPPAAAARPRRVRYHPARACAVPAAAASGPVGHFAVGQAEPPPFAGLRLTPRCCRHRPRMRGSPGPLWPIVRGRPRLPAGTGRAVPDVPWWIDLHSLVAPAAGQSPLLVGLRWERVDATVAAAVLAPQRLHSAGAAPPSRPG